MASQAAELQRGWKPWNVGLRGSWGLKCHNTAREGCSVLKRRSATLNQSAGIRVRKLHPTTQPKQELCFSRVLVTARLDREGLPCLELLTMSRCHILAPHVAVALRQGCAPAEKSRDAAGKCKYPTNSWDLGGMESAAHGHTDSFQQRRESSPDPEAQVCHQTRKFPSPVAQPG